MDLAKMIYLYNDSAPITAKWDGKEYELTSNPVEVQLGIAEHWVKRFPNAQLRIEDVPTEVIEKRKPVNPLESNDRGTAFAELKRPGRRKASDE